MSPPQSKEARKWKGMYQKLTTRLYDYQKRENVTKENFNLEPCEECTNLKKIGEDCKECGY
jgi:hypothetical protein